MLTKLDATKKVVSLIIGAGTSKIVKGIIQNNTDPTSVADKATIVAATFVVGAMVSDATSAYTDKKIDELAVWIDKVKAQIKEAKSEEPK